jgi:hypothetical protein
MSHEEISQIEPTDHIIGQLSRFKNYAHPDPVCVVAEARYVGGVPTEDETKLFVAQDADPFRPSQLGIIEVDGVDTDIPSIDVHAEGLLAADPGLLRGVIGAVLVETGAERANVSPDTNLPEEFLILAGAKAVEQTIYFEAA